MFKTFIADPNSRLFQDINPMIGLEFHLGTFEELEPNITGPACIANAGNSLGIMGAGVAGAIQRRYSALVEWNVRSAISSGKLLQEVAASCVVKLGPLADTYKYCAYTITMKQPGETLDPDGRIPFNCMLSTLRAVERFNELHTDPIKTLVVPGFGAGIGGLDPVRVGVEMEEAYEEWFNE